MDPDYFIEYKEPPDGPSAQMLSQAAKENNVYLYGGRYHRLTYAKNCLYMLMKIIKMKQNVAYHLLFIYLLQTHWDLVNSKSP